MISHEALEQAQAWLEQDPDPDTRAELSALIEAGSAELEERFAGPLTFGTAGLRGRIGAGESRMNRAVVRRASYGLGRYLLNQHPDAKERGVVVGYDGRRLSKEFAEDSAAVLCALGIKVMLSDKVCPTPLLAFAVNHLKAVSGIMVTASHNPPEYNGYKVYADNAAQIVPPADSLIAASIDGAPPADEITLADLEQAKTAGLLTNFGSEVDDDYLAAIATLRPDEGAGRDMTIAYTALHGVGAHLFKQAFTKAGFPNLISVAKQEQPDGEFPTVNFPNPEEPGALDLVLALAADKQAPLVLANDPDADRLAAAVRLADGSYRQLSGNELGILIGHHCLTRETIKSPLVITTVVSSPWLGAVASALGAAYDSVLTGFKWIATTAMKREQTEGLTFVFGYEEAIGYSVGPIVRDKDGIGTAVVVAAMAAELYAKGETLLDELERIARRYGLFVSRQKSMGFDGIEGKQQMDAMMARLRAQPPQEIGGFAVLRCSDCLTGLRRDRDGDFGTLSLPQSNVLIYDLEGGHRAIARPSGTEPKIKLYLDMHIPLAEGESFADAEARGSAEVAALQQAFMGRVAG